MDSSCSSMDRVRYDALRLVTSSAVPGALAAVVRLNVFEALAAAGDGAQLTAEEIMARALPGKAVNLSYGNSPLALQCSNQNVHK